MSEKEHNEEPSLRKVLLNGYTAMRPLENEEFYNPQADVIYMLAYVLRTVEANFQTDNWPDLTEFLTEDKGEKPDEIFEQLRQMHLTVGRMVAWITHEHPEEGPKTIYEAMDQAGWMDIPRNARVGYLAMLGLTMLARVWVVGKQGHLVGNSPSKPIDKVAEATSQIMRMADQSVNPIQEANRVLAAAVQHAASLGMPMSVILQTVNNVLASEDGADPAYARDLRASNGLNKGGEL